MNETDKATTDQRDADPPGDAADASAADSAAGGADLGSSELLSEILTSVYRAEGMTAQGFAALRERLAVIENRLGISIDRSEDAGPAEDETVAGPRDEADSSAASETESTVVQTPSDDPSEVETFPELPPVAQPASDASHTPASQEASLPPVAQPVRDVRPAPAPSGGELEAIVFGQDLAYYESLLPERQALLAAVCQGDEDAIGLVGQLLIVRSATMDRLPTLLKDVGEAWYRWRGDRGADADPLRDAVIAWLHTRLESVGLGNRIELVRVGDRYDSKRHNAKARGIEITGVQGWVVLRDNGNVYTKANVTVA